MTGTATTVAARELGTHSRRRPWAAAALLTAAALVVPLSGPATGVSGATGATTSTRTLLSVIDPAVSAASVAALVRARGGQVLATYAIASALLVDLPVGVAAPTGTVAVPDSPLHVSSAPAAAAPVVGATYRTTVGAGAEQGAGVTVAVVDTGVADVPDLAGRLSHVNVSGGPAGDGLGHGTFLAGLVAGDGDFPGVAPAARVLDVQVAQPDGATSLSKVLAGLQAVADRRAADATLRVLSLALTSGSPLPPSVDPLTRGLDRLWARGITVVVAAGNDGPDRGTVGSPGNDPTLITVGALDEHGTAARADDDVADFSSRGSQFGRGKPDLVAPGVSLISTRAPGSIAETQNPQSWVGDGYLRGTGTSMAEAVTAGAAAVLIGVRPALTPDSVKKLVTATAYDTAGLNARNAGAGGLDLAAAVAAAPAARIVGRVRWTGDRADDGRFGPTEADAAAWADFAQAWQEGDLEAAAAAWVQMSAQARRWAATSFAASLVTSGLAKDPAEYAALVELARRWAGEDWNARRWADDSWVARRWASEDWAARRWALADWSARRWADEGWNARRWAAEIFDARRWAEQGWNARRWADVSWDARRWADDAWAARRWAGEDWLAFAWTARRWATADWATAAWTERDWSARRWSSAEFDSWGWSARRWSSDTWDARRWSTLGWDLVGTQG